MEHLGYTPKWSKMTISINWDTDAIFPLKPDSPKSSEPNAEKPPIGKPAKMAG